MPTVETTGFHQKAVVWTTNGTTNRYGEPEVNQPLEIDVRWEEGLSESITEDALPIAAEGTVHVDRDIAQGSVMWLGSLSDLPSPINEATGLAEVISLDKVPDIRGRDYKRTVKVRKWRGALPMVV